MPYKNIYYRLPQNQALQNYATPNRDIDNYENREIEDNIYKKMEPTKT